ncbi:hypothetical protein, partial [Bacteroides sp.]|uniref:hypothetical protein n=1 Tax=Bacteroides sp. TaxID=29523 RepID=UPI0023CDCABD
AHRSLHSSSRRHRHMCIIDMYKKYNVNAVICCFDGYTGLYSEEECISIKEQLEKIRKDSTLKPYWDYSPKEVPILEKFREEIYAFLTDGRE